MRRKHARFARLCTQFRHQVIIRPMTAASCITFERRDDLANEALDALGNVPRPFAL
jgi:hypothetical protein